MRNTTIDSHHPDSRPQYLVRLVLLAAAVLAIVFGPGALFATESDDANAKTQRPPTSSRAPAASASPSWSVEVGGKVTHELKIIRAVGAQLTADQRDTLAEHPDVSRVWRDREAEVQSAGTLTVLDRFDSSSFSNDDGPDSWAGSWQENDRSAAAAAPGPARSRWSAASCASTTSRTPAAIPGCGARSTSTATPAPP